MQMMQLARRIVNRFKYEVAFYRLIQQRRREFENDPDYRPERVAEGCQDRVEEEIDDSLILRRIMTSYRKAKVAQIKAAQVYQVSSLWLPIYQRKLRGVMKALADENLDELATMYRNFYRDPCSTGLVGVTPNMKKHYFSGKIKKKHQSLYLFDILCRFRLWSSLLGPGYTARDLVSPNIGNPFGLVIDGVFVPSGSDYMHYYATELNRMVADNSSQVVVELGGGFGGMAYYLLRDSSRTTYVDFDLPENMALTAYYLLRAHPEMKAALYGEDELSSETLQNNRIVLMPNFEISKMPSKSAAAVFNSYSLAEMSTEAIQEYIQQMTRISRKYFFHINRTEGVPVEASSFGIEKYGYELLYQKPGLWNRGRSLVVGEREYLYSRSDQKSRSIL